MDSVEVKDRRSSSYRCHSEPPIMDIRIHPAGTWRASQAVPLNGGSVQSFVQLSEAAQDLAERVAHEVRAFAAARLEAFVVEHRKILEDSLHDPFPLMPRRQTAADFMSSQAHGSRPSAPAPPTPPPPELGAVERPSPKNSLLEPASAAALSSGPRPSSQHSAARSDRTERSVEERFSGPEFMVQQALRSSVTSSCGSSKPMVDVELPGAANLVPLEPTISSRESLGRRKKSGTTRQSDLSRGPRSRMSSRSDLSCSASINDLERAVAKRLVESQGLSADTQARKSNQCRNSNGRRPSLFSGSGGGQSSYQNTGTSQDKRKSSIALGHLDLMRSGGSRGSIHAAPEACHNGEASNAGNCSLAVRETEDVSAKPTASTQDTASKDAETPTQDQPLSFPETPDNSATLQRLHHPRPALGSPSSTTSSSFASRRISRFLLAGVEHFRRLSIGSVIPEGSVDTPNTRSLRASTQDGQDDFDEIFTTSSLRRAQDFLLTRQALQPASEEEEEDINSGEAVAFSCVVLLWLRIWGIFPWVVRLPCRMLSQENCFLGNFAAHWNQLLMLLLSLTVVGYRLSALLQPDTRLYHVSDFLLAFGSFLCIASTRCIHKNDLFDMSQGVWLLYAQKRCFVMNWQRQSKRHLVMIVVGWLCTVTCRVVLGGVETRIDLTDGLLSAQSSSMLDSAAFAFTAGIFFSTIFCTLHFVNALVQGVDSFGRTFQGNQDFNKSVQDWNVLQALLRQASLALENGILVLLTTVMLMLFMCAVDVTLGRFTDTAVLGTLLPRLAPTFLIAVGTGHVLVHCAGVTGRCGRVSPFVTSTLASSKGSRELIAQRLVLVQYIDSSAAGFYIREVLVTAADALKVMYLGGMIMVTIVTKAATLD